MDNSNPHWQQELSAIYLKLSLEIDTDFDTIDEDNFIINSINNCYDNDFLMIDSKELIGDINKLNVMFVRLIHYCNKNFKFKNVTKLFLGFCDFFNLDYHAVYIKLHEKLQELIKLGFTRMIGGLKNFNKLKKKYDPENVFTLFDLIK